MKRTQQQEVKKAKTEVSKSEREAKEASSRLDRIRKLLSDLTGDAEFLMVESRNAANHGSVAFESNDKLEQLEAALRNVRAELHD